jgi:hypothetical protein
MIRSFFLFLLQSAAGSRCAGNVDRFFALINVLVETFLEKSLSKGNSVFSSPAQ